MTDASRDPDGFEADPDGFEEDPPPSQEGLRAIHGASTTKDPANYAKALDLSRKTGAPIGIVEKRTQDFAQAERAASFNAEEWEKNNPEQARIVKERPELAPLVFESERKVSWFTKMQRRLRRYGFMDNPLTPFAEKLPAPFGGIVEAVGEPMRLINPLGGAINRAIYGDPKPEQKPEMVTYQASPVRGSVNIAADTFTRALKQQALGRLEAAAGYNEALAFALGTPAAQASAERSRKEAGELRNELGPEPDYEQNALEQLVIDVTQGVPSQVQQFGAYGAGAITAGVVAGAATLAATKGNVPAAVAAARAAAPLGAKIAGSGSSFVQEFGSSFPQMRNSVDDSGRKLDPVVAIGAAAIAAAASAGVELGTIPFALKAFGPAGEALAGGATKEAVLAAAKSSQFRSAFRKVGLAWIKSAGAEAGEGGAQAFIGTAAEWAAHFGGQTLSTGKLAEDVIEGAYKEGISAGLGTGAVQSTIHSAQLALRRDASKTGAAQAAGVAEVADSNLAKSAPDVVAKLIADETEKSGQRVESIYVDPHKFTSAIEAMGADGEAAMRDLLGEDAKGRLERAIAESVDAPGMRNTLEVPLDEFNRAWGGHAITKSMLDDLATRPGHFTARELAEKAPEVEKKAEEVAKAEQATEEAVPVEIDDDAFAALPKSTKPDHVEALRSAAYAIGVDEPLYRSPADMGGDVEAFKRYIEGRAESLKGSALRMKKALAKEQAKEATDAWKAEVKNNRETAEVEFDQRPDWRAWRYLKKGEMYTEDGGVVIVPDLGHLDLELLSQIKRSLNDDIDGAEFAKRLGTRVVKASTGKKTTLRSAPGRVGEDPNEVAQRFGYADARAMLKAIIELPERKAWVGTRAEEITRESHPELEAEIGRLTAAADAAIHAEGTSDMLLKELATLRRRSGLPETTPNESIRLGAKHIVDKTPVRRLSVAVLHQRERAAAEQTIAETAKGNFARALAFKQAHVLAHYQWRELDKAREMRDDFEEVAGKLRTDKYRERLGKAGAAYRDVVDSLLEAIGISEPREQSDDSQRQSVGTLVSMMEQNGDEPTFDPFLIERITKDKRQWKELTVAELREVRDALKNIKKAATNRNTVLVNGVRRDRDEVIDELIAEWGRSALLPQVSEQPSTEAAASVLQSLSSVGGSIDGLLMRQEFMLHQLAGGERVDSATFRAIIEPLQAGKHGQTDILNRAVKPIVDAWHKMPKGVRASMMDSVDGRALFPTHSTPTNIGPPSRKYELFAMLLNLGNEGNLKRLTEGRMITKEQVVAAVATLGKETIEYAQTVLDSVEGLGKLSFDLDERDRGIRPEKVTAAPVDIPMPDGTTVHFRGGYYPAVGDPRGGSVGAIREAGNVADILGNPTSRPSTSRSRLKKRADEINYVISLDPAIIHGHLVESAHDIAYREKLRSVASIILDERIQTELIKRLGIERTRTLKTWLQDIGRMESAQADAHAGRPGKWMRQIRSNIPISVLGYAIDNAKGDLSGFGTVLIKSGLKKKHFGAALLSYAKDTEKTRAWALENSGELRHRADELYQGFEKQVRSLVQSNKYGAEYVRFIKDNAFFLQEKVENATVTPAWVGAYRQAAAEGKSHADAVAFADLIIRNNFPAKSVVDKSAIQRDRGFLGYLAMFNGYANLVYNLDRRIWQPVFAAQGLAGKASELPKAALAHLALMTVVGPVSEFLVGRGPDEDEEFEEWFARKLLVAHLLPLPAIGGYIESWVMGRATSSRDALFNLADTIGRLLKETFSDDPDAAKVAKEALKAISIVFGLPFSRPARAVEGAVKAIDGELNDDSATGAASAIIYGERRGSPLNPITAVGKLLE